ncbi:VOC family protein [Virgibacillus kekensis]|uniref:VOC family protein n=1 Tax=Virgibacillus kekensis TaxID=202261 RepID=A0ABV9DNF3_9BACI
MNKLIPHIRIKNCKEELPFYQEVFGGKIKNTQLADGIEMFKGYEGKFIHAELHINEYCIIYFADVFGESYAENGNILLGPDLESEEEINTIYSRLKEEGTVQMELKDTFFGVPSMPS